MITLQKIWQLHVLQRLINLGDCRDPSPQYPIRIKNTSQDKRDAFLFQPQMRKRLRKFPHRYFEQNFLGNLKKNEADLSL